MHICIPTSMHIICMHGPRACIGTYTCLHRNVCASMHQYHIAYLQKCKQKYSCNTLLYVAIGFAQTQTCLGTACKSTRVRTQYVYAQDIQRCTHAYAADTSRQPRDHVSLYAVPRLPTPTHALCIVGKRQRACRAHAELIA